MNKKSIFQTVLFALAILIATGLTSCEKDDGGKGGENEEMDERYQEIIANYIDVTVVPTYKALAEAALVMREANNALKTAFEADEMNDSHMKAAADAWMAARIQWELSEAFLFGPVGEQAYDIDAHIDDWPLEIEEIYAKLEEIEEGGRVLTGKEVWEWDEDVIGFHVTEYLLYRDGKARPVADITWAETVYLTAATDALVWDCVMAYVAWVGTTNAESKFLTVFRENPAVEELYNTKNNYQNFATKMKPVSEGGNYPSWKDAVAEIATGASEIAEEVGVTKIEAPYKNNRTEEVESWYSWHSLDDYENNILSIKNAYYGVRGSSLGSPANAASASLSALIKELNPELDTQIKEKIEECIKNIRAIGGNGQISFYEVVRNKKENGDMSKQEVVEEAVDSCIDLMDLFDLVDETLE
ncbi:MAG: hypothetical protein LUG98_05150 [Tannerellaceae bacterium]|nr:hypothetical protein [Tannerellaceae bacterium]